MERREQREGEAVLSFWVPSLKERRTHRHRKYGPPSKRSLLREVTQKTVLTVKLRPVFN
jgi:hypothetical protein